MLVFCLQVAGISPIQFNSIQKLYLNNVDPV